MVWIGALPCRKENFELIFLKSTEGHFLWKRIPPFVCSYKNKILNHRIPAVHKQAFKYIEAGNYVKIYWTFQDAICLEQDNTNHVWDFQLKENPSVITIYNSIRGQMDAKTLYMEFPNSCILFLNVSHWTSRFFFSEKFPNRKKKDCRSTAKIKAFRRFLSIVVSMHNKPNLVIPLLLFLTTLGNRMARMPWVSRQIKHSKACRECYLI